MPNRSSSAQPYDVLVAISRDLEQKHIGAIQLWQHSPFRWLVEGIPSRTIGKIGEELVLRFCKKYGIAVKKVGDSDADLLINNRRVEVKFSTLWRNGKYTFQQIRDQNYEFIVALGVSPNTAHCWVIPKDDAWNNADKQHGGQRGSDTRWIRIDPKNPPDWLKKYGGDLNSALKRLRGL
jgi:hypothetical protein